MSAKVSRQEPAELSVDVEKKIVLEPPRELPVAAEADVVVAGGSLTGVCAALAAARNGADVLLVERYGFLGGQMTAGVVCSAHRPLPCSEGEHGEEPIFVEILRRCVDASGLKHSWEDIEKDALTDVMLNPEVVKYVLFQMAGEAGVRLLLHSFVCDTIVEDGAVKGIIVENKGGRSALLGQVVVDATGDADVAARAGAPYTLRPVKKRMGPGMLSLMCNVNIAKTLRYLKEHPDQYAYKVPLEEIEKRTKRDHVVKRGAFFGFADLVNEAAEKGEFPRTDQVGFYWLGRGIAMMSGYPGPPLPAVDCLNPDEVTNAEISLRKFLWKKAEFFKNYIPGFEEASLILTGVHMGIRETRSIATEHVLKAKDVEAARQFKDTVIRIVGATGSTLYHVITDHPLRMGSQQLGDEVIGELQIPYRTLIPKSVDNVLVAGRCIAYMIGAGALAGQAAGTAAALAVKAGVTPRRLDVLTLQEKLREQGFVYATILP